MGDSYITPHLLLLLTPYIFQIKRAWHNLELLLNIFKVRESDENDLFRERCVQLLDNFQISGINGNHVCMVRLA
jgi:hypothetical protein